MSGVRVLVGTRKGAFILTADGSRTRWEVSGPHFGGWEDYGCIAAGGGGVRRGAVRDPGALAGG